MGPKDRCLIDLSVLPRVAERDPSFYRKRGRIRVTTDAIGLADKDCLKALFKDLIVLSTLEFYSEGIVEYLVLCEHFAEVPLFETAPMYEVIIRGEVESFTRKVNYRVNFVKHE